MNQRLLLRISLTLTATLIILAGSRGGESIHLSGKVSGGSGKHAIYVALWDAQSFLKHPVQQVRIEPGAAASFQFQIPEGRWALSAFEDQNDNGVLDMGVFGPKEPSGFWHPFHGWRKPRFDDVAVQVDRDTTDVTIELKR
ncbi:MAG TPA: DUF2141 domain-containing protein [Candidatus Sulfotelmatobacter sp.]|nr:DUF2141 domain-containing protein [Candidatus Sulfotelmatobacter sp.]